MEIKIEIKIDTTRPVYEWDCDIPSPLYTLIIHAVSTQSGEQFDFERYYNKQGKTYYRHPISVGPLFDVNHRTIGYLIYYKGYEIQIDNVLNEICIIK